MSFGRINCARLKLLISLSVVMLCNGLAIGQNFDYLQKARESLSKGDCEKAQKLYNVYKEVEQRTNNDLEKQISDCIEYHKKPINVTSNNTSTITVPLYPLYVKDFSVSQKGSTLSDSEIRTLFANSQSYDLYDKGMRLNRNSSIPSSVLCTLGGLMIGGGAILHGIKVKKANGVGDMINSLDHGDSFKDLDEYYYYPWNHNYLMNEAKRESLVEAQAQYEKQSRNGLYIVAGGVASILVGVLWNSAMKASGQSKVRKAVELYNKGQLHAQNDVEMKYGLTGNGVYLSFLF